jgi:hypothetical protein
MRITSSSHLRFWKCFSTVFLGAALFVGPLSAGPPQENATITVQVSNWASVAPRILTDAENQATQVFRASGVAVSWLNCPLTISEAEANPICIAPCPPSRISVRINSEMPADLPKTTLGVALSETATYATVYYPRVDDYARLGIATHSQILGHAIAHEMGHLLLGRGQHALFGIMRGVWTAEDLRQITMGAFLFSAPQSKVIRQAVIRRMHTGDIS